MLVALLVSSACLSLPQDASAGSQAPPPPAVPAPLGPPNTYRAPFVGTPIALDGKLDDPQWDLAPWTSDFVDIEGSSKPTPRYRTRAKMLWSDDYLYIGAELEEPDVWATYREHDQIVFHEPDFEAFIDPDGDGRAYYELEVNCLGTIFDLFLPRMYREGGPAVHSWNCEGLKTAIHVYGSANDPRDEDQRWTLEWAIPWKALVPPTKDADGKELPDVSAERERKGAAPKPGDTWRINFSRVQWKHNFEELDEHGKRVGPQHRPTAPLPDNDSIKQAPIPRYEKRKGLAEDNWVWSPQWLVDMHLPDRWGKVTFVREPAAPPIAPTPTTPSK
ncbi:MAG: carbohydrate-binding family 9-like protein [Phycisphaerales bacterium]